MSARRLIFDLDGTLVDTVEGLCATGNALLADLGREPVDADTYKRFIGRGMKVQVERLLNHTGGVPDCGVDRAHARFMEIYDPVAGATAYPGATAAVAALAGAGWRVGVCTQKPEEAATGLLDALGFPIGEGGIETLAGGDTIDGVLKPDPRLVAAAADRLGDGALYYVGDSEIDALTARNAKAAFVLHLNGYHTGAVEDLTPDATFEEFRVLPWVLNHVAMSREMAEL